ncbi:hypothetical protein SEVIR_2G399200v4 [Setaria viridis]
MEADAPLDFALFQLSPRRQRCELVVSGNGRTEKIASGSVKPFVAHLRAAEEQASAQPPPPAIRLQLERRAPWFSKGTLERFVRFVSTPEVLELANTYDLEMSQLEGARKIYAQGGTGDATSGAAAENVTTSAAAAAAADNTKKELLRAIDVRLSALKQDLAAACSRASSAGFNPNSVSELLLFANHFGANRLSEACTKFMSLCQRHPDISPQNAPPAVSSHWKGFDDGNVRGSSSSDMSIDEPQVDLGESNNKSTVGGSDSQIHRLSNSQGSVHVSSEPVAEQQTKSTIQQAADKQETETDASPATAIGVSRRLSVKDRISMFESQKKEQTPSSGNSTSAGTGRVVPGKGEHRRVPSGASMEKLVRRWSSVSDMSIDLSNNDSGNLNDRKENGTPVATPTSADLEANSKAGVDEGSNGLKDSVTSQSCPCQKDNVSMDSTTKNLCPAPNLSNTSAPHNESTYSAEDDMVINSSIESESSFGKEPGFIQGHTRMSNKADSNVSTRSRLKTSAKPVEETLMKDKDILTSPSSEEHFRMIDKEIEGVAHEVPASSEQIPQNDIRGPRLRTKDIRTEAEVIGRKDQPSRTFEKISGGVKSKASSNSRANVRGSSGRDEVTSTETEVHDVRVQRNRPARKAEDVGRKVTAGSDSDCSGRQGTNLSRQSSITDQELNMQARIRPGKGNQDRHGELQMKANELEKLYAAHKLTSSRRVKPTDVQVDSTPMVSEVKPIAALPDTIYTKQVVKESITTNDCDANELLKMVNNPGYNISTPQKLGILSLEESRGKFYEQYMQKRDAKLKEDWKLQREEKEAMLKAMHESLERSKAEMIAKFSRSADVPDSTYVSHYSQKIPPLQSARKNKDQGVDSFLVEEELNSDYLSGDGSSRSADSRKHFSNKVASTQNQKTSVAPIHKRSSRTVSSSYANRRNPPENPLAQSVPNFSDLRKENTRPSPGLRRATTRVQQKSFARSKSIIEESKSILKEDQSRRSQSMRKSQIPDELKDSPSVNEDVYNWAPSRISNNESEGAFAYSTRRTGPPKAFLRKGNGTHPVVGIAGFQAAAAMMANALQHNESSGDFEDQQEDSPDDAKEEEEYESIEENLRESDFPADSDSENPRVSHEFGNSDDPGSENGDVHFPSEVTGLGGTKFTAFTGNVHNPTGDLPAPWSSRLPQLFPYANDNSDGDAFADSPSGSPSPWNSHSLDEITDADVSRMRKKWGSAQMPFAGVNASQQPRKDVSKGLKKLWKFGRKNRGGDGLVNDWVSASTASECDDDMEDGRDLVVGSSDDFRKSRMGYLASYDGFVENEVFAEQGTLLSTSLQKLQSLFLNWLVCFSKYYSHIVRALDKVEGKGDFPI